ncbi:MAG: hypothetical protein Q9227_009031 [Pyrenula ochraceoflavens]
MPKPGLAEDKKSIVISPGQTWDEVYEVLDAEDLATLGGRVAGVGVVLASGSIVNANSTHHRDLWKALRGGSNNFGIVTSITQRTFPQGPFWGGQTFHLSSTTRPDQFSALESLISTKPYDPYAHFICNLLISNASAPNWIIGDSLQYTKSPPEPNPPTFKPFLDLPRIPLYPGGPDNSLRVTNFTDVSREYAALAFYPKRWLFATLSFANSARMMEEFYRIADRVMAPYYTLQGFALSMAYQPLPTIMSSRRDSSVDSLGPLEEQGDMFFVHWAMSVDDSEKEKDEELRAAVKRVFKEAETKAEELGVKRRYLAMTYADEWQDVFGSYGEESVREMVAVSREYDPEGVFQRMVPGGFKLPMGEEKRVHYGLR